MSEDLAQHPSGRGEIGRRSVWSGGGMRHGALSMAGAAAAPQRGRSYPVNLVARHVHNG